MQECYARSLDNAIERTMKEKTVVILEGIKGSGKAEIAQKFSKSLFQLDKKDTIELTEIDPYIALNGEKPRGICEWQASPALVAALVEAIKENTAAGQFILTASTKKEDKKTNPDLKEENVARFLVRPMSLTESKESRELVSLKGLFENGDQRLFNKNKSSNIREMAFLLCRGGWHDAVTTPRDTALDATKKCCSSLFCHEFCKGGKFRNKKQDILQHILKSYSMQISRDAPITLIRDKIHAVMGKRLDDKTMATYLETLQDLYITEDLPALAPQLKSGATPRLTPARYLTDPSIATTLLGVTADTLLGDLKFFEMLFKNMCLRDIRIYSYLSCAKLSHYRDNLGLECDVIAQTEENWAAINIRLGGQARIEEAVEALKRLKAKVAEKKPIFMMVVTATGMCYRRADGIYVVPLNCLTY